MSDATNIAPENVSNTAQSINKGMDTAAKKVDKTFNSIQSSRLGKKLPMEIKSVTLHDILTGLFILKLLTIPAIYMLAQTLVADTSDETGFFYKCINTAISVFKSVGIFIILAEIMIIGVICALKMKKLYFVAVIIIIIKNIMMVFITPRNNLTGILGFTCYIVHIGTVVFLDLVLLFYLYIFLKEAPEEDKKFDIGIEYAEGNEKV